MPLRRDAGAGEVLPNARDVYGEALRDVAGDLGHAAGLEAHGAPLRQRLLEQARLAATPAAVENRQIPALTPEQALQTCSLVAPVEKRESGHVGIMQQGHYAAQA